MVQVFLCHASEDKTRVEEIYRRMQELGFQPWMDKKNLLPGQRWDEEIRRALRASDFVLIFLSQNSVAKRGYVQREFKLALDALEEMSEGVIHTIPVRLDNCDVPEQLRKLQWADLFDAEGFSRIVQAIRVGLSQRQQLEPEATPELPAARKSTLIPPTAKAPNATPRVNNIRQADEDDVGERPQARPIHRARRAAYSKRVRFFAFIGFFAVLLLVVAGFLYQQNLMQLPQLLQKVTTVPMEGRRRAQRAQQELDTGRQQLQGVEAEREFLQKASESQDPGNVHCDMSPEDMLTHFEALEKAYFLIRHTIERSNERRVAILSTWRSKDLVCYPEFERDNQSEIGRLKELEVDKNLKVVIEINYCAGLIIDELEVSFLRSSRTAAASQRITRIIDKLIILVSNTIDRAMEMSYFKNKIYRLTEEYESYIKLCR